MAKLLNMFIVLIAIQACLLIYGGADAGGVQHNVVWDFINNLSTWSTGGLILGFIGLAGGIGLLGVAAASAFGFKTDFLIFAPAIAGFISVGAVFAQLASVIRSDLISLVFHSCSIDAPLSVACGPVNLIIGLTVGIWALTYVMTIISWWRNSDF